MSPHLRPKFLWPLHGQARPAPIATVMTMQPVTDQCRMTMVQPAVDFIMIRPMATMMSTIYDHRATTPSLYDQVTASLDHLLWPLL